jgi:hypothetical protein
MIARANSTAADVDVGEGDAFGLQLVGDFEDAIERGHERGYLGNLRADVESDAGDREVRQIPRAAIQPQRVAMGHAELVLPHPGRDVVVGARVDVRIDAQAHGRGLADLRGHPVQARQLAFRFDVEAQDAYRQRLAHFVGGLADAREHCLARVPARGEHAVQLTPGDDIEPASQPGQQVEHG